MLSTIYEWSVEHIRRVFEAKSEDEARRAMDATFARDVDFSTNGKQLAHADLERFVLAMLAASGFRLKVQWQNALEVPRDESNRVSVGVPGWVCDACAEDGVGAGRRAGGILHHQQRPQAVARRRAGHDALRATQVRERRVSAPPPPPAHPHSPGRPAQHRVAVARPRGGQPADRAPEPDRDGQAAVADEAADGRPT